MNTNRRGFLRLGIGSMLAALVAPLVKWLPAGTQGAEATVTEAATTINVTSGSADYAGDVIQIGDEAMQVAAFNGKVLTVKALYGRDFLTVQDYQFCNVAGFGETSSRSVSLRATPYVLQPSEDDGDDDCPWCADGTCDDDEEYGDYGPL